MPDVFSHDPPGGCGIEGEDESWDFGTGAGFYVDATEEPWKNNYRMYSYVTEEVSSHHQIVTSSHHIASHYLITSRQNITS